MLSLTEIIESLIENADFEEVQSVSKAKAFATAAKRWLILAPSTASKEGASLSMNAQEVADLMRRAQAFIAANDTSIGNRKPGVRFLEVGARQ